VVLKYDKNKRDAYGKRQPSDCLSGYGASCAEQATRRVGLGQGEGKGWIDTWGAAER
jgi:hypothetical protein